jgi:hypothetical protein
LPNNLGLNGAQAQKPTRFAPIYTGRWSSGLWTNRSPLRDANTTREVEKFYGPAGDALIAGLNTEVTTRLTLARRPGNSIYDPNSWVSPDRFYSFRLFSSNSEQIDVMVDQASALYSLYAGTQTLVFNKSSGSRETYMQSVGNTLYFGNSIDNKKWLQTLEIWVAGATWNTASTPLFSTFIIDPNGNIQQLTGGTTFVSGGTMPTWSTVVPAAGNDYQGGLTTDGGVVWTNRGNPIENWGIANDGTAVVPVVGTSRVAWNANTYYSIAGAIIDTNGNLQMTTTAGTSGAVTPTWATVVGNSTTDGTVTWIMIQTAASMVWAAHTSYVSQSTFSLSSVAAASGGHTVYTGTIVGGASNFFAGTTFIISGFTNTVNNGTYLCSASSTTTLTLVNTAGVVEALTATAFTPGQYIIGNASGTNCLFNLTQSTQPYITGNVSAYQYGAGGFVGGFTMYYPTTLGSASSNTTTLTSLNAIGAPLGTGANFTWSTVNGAGELSGGTIFPAAQHDYQLIVLATLQVPVAGQYTFQIEHHDGMIWGMGNGATLISGTNDNPQSPPQTVTAYGNYPVFGGTNRGLGGGGEWNDTFTVNCPTAGPYSMEFDYAYWYHSGQSLVVKCQGMTLANGNAESGATQPIWPSWSLAYAPNYPNIQESAGRYTWNNIGPTVDFTWQAERGFTLPDTTIIDKNGYQEGPYRTGYSGSVVPTFSTVLNALTADNPNLTWINQGIAAAPPAGTVSTYNGGWEYAVALVNTLDDTVSNASPLSAATGNFIGAGGVTIPPGAGLPPLADIDPQADYVAIYRTTDGESTPFLIPGANTEYTIPLSVYLVSGYVDTTPDTGLNNLIQAALEGENTPPALGAINLTYHLNRIFYSIGNIVYWTSGPDTPDGNGINGSSPLDYDSFPSLVKRIVPTASGALVFTVSDVYLIQGAGTSSNPIQSGIPLMKGVGLLSYNALDINGSIIGFFTTDNQFCIIDPSSGVDYAGFPIGDQFRLNDGGVGTSWNAADVYVAWHVSGEDQGWYVCDGATGWYRLMPTPSPEQGYTWSTFAQIVGGVQALQSIEVSPGLHKLLLGPTGTGPILNRSLSSWQDNGTSYVAWAVVGSAVLAQPGQVAVVSFITTESVKTGTPLSISCIFDEALPYYTGPWATITASENDPPTLKPSTSFFSQRFYASDLPGIEDEAVCRHMQVRINWTAENAQNELATMTIFGAFLQEK